VTRVGRLGDTPLEDDRDEAWWRKALREGMRLERHFAGAANWTQH